MIEIEKQSILLNLLWEWNLKLLFILLETVTSHLVWLFASAEWIMSTADRTEVGKMSLVRRLQGHSQFMLRIVETAYGYKYARISSNGGETWREAVNKKMYKYGLLQTVKIWVINVLLLCLCCWFEIIQGMSNIVSITIHNYCSWTFLWCPMVIS